MKCPACSNALSVRNVSGVALDVCDNGCGGIWFDQFEFRKFDEAIEPDAETLLQLNIKRRTQASGANLDCPKCSGIKMMRHFSSVKQKVTMDECPKCAGVWLDAGELASIRSEYATEPERQHAARAAYDEMFDAKLMVEQHRADAKYSKFLNFSRALRFVCPSYYRGIKQSSNGS